LYAYERQVTADRPSHSAHGPIEAWIDARLAEDNALTNYQAHHLLGLAVPAGLEPGAELAQARQLVDAFFLVGVTEQFDDSLLLLARRMRLPVSAMSYRRVNVTHSQERFPINDHVRQRLLDLNQIDLELYEYARQKLALDLAGIPSAALEAQRRQLARHNQRGPGALPFWRRLLNRM
jgi:hypothetical protein